MFLRFLICFSLASKLLMANVSKPGLWLPSILSDHMVLQQDKSLSVWGWASPYESLQLNFADLHMQCRANKDGAFNFQLPEMNPGGPYEMQIHGQSQELQIHDVLVGEVWLASGQSNMEFPMRLSKDAALDLPEAADAQLRLFVVNKRSATERQDDVDGQWELCNASSAAPFSALAYYFGKELREVLGMPVGMIEDVWSGSPGETWLPEDDLKALPPFAARPGLAEAPDAERELWSSGRQIQLDVRKLRLLMKGSAWAPKLSGSWTHYEAKGDDASVNSVDSSAFEYAGSVHGGSWASASLPLTAHDFSKVEAIQFEARGQGSFSLRLGQEDIKDGDTYGSESFAASADWQPEEIRLATLKQGGWGEAVSFTPQAAQTLDFAAVIPQVPELPGLAFNGMIAPLQGFRIRGVLWYQGESNIDEGKDYEGLLEALIASWRRLWADAKLPFYVVQLPNFGTSCPAPCESAWASLREAQRQACLASGSTLVTSIDLGDPSNIHPKEKVRLAERLARAAEVQLYGKKGEALGPRFASATREGSQVVLRCTGGPLQCADGQAPRGFSVAGADGRYYEANASLHERSLELSCEAVPQARRLRYDWADNPDGNLVDGEGLPLTPFEAPVAASGR